jgi:hypothetical protein
MIDLDDIIRQVLDNCSISDARHAGLYSVCGLALRLRNLYKWEKGLDPWVEGEPSAILEWIGDKEEEWDARAERDFHEITIVGNPYDPFDTRGINGVLESHGVYYGVGYVHSLKPTFFLAVVEDKKQVNGHTVFVLGQELARDLLTVPALSQGDCIILRRESAKLFLWDQIFYVRKSGRDALRFALELHGLDPLQPQALHRNLEMLCSSEMESYMYHELGEIQDTIFDRDMWREIIGAFPHSPVELLARAVKDLLADTNQYGTLRHIAREDKAASLGLYVAFVGGLTKELFPELTEAFQDFIKTRDWKVIGRAISAGFDTAKHYAESLCRIYRTGREKKDPEWAAAEIEKQLLVPLGVGRHRET